MSAGFTLTLDTTAPQVTWGAVTNAVASEEMAVEYLLDEPGVDHAEVELRDGRVLSMVVGPSLLTVVLPGDTPEGQTTVRLYVVDEVANSATRTLPVYVSGVIAVEPPPVGRPARARRRLMRSGSSEASTASSSRVAVRVTHASRLRVRSHYVAPSERVLRWRSTATLDYWTSMVANARSRPSAATAFSSSTVTRRPEGPRAEEEILLLLGLL